MAKAKAKEYRELGADVLSTKVKELEAGLFDMKFQASMGKLEDSSKLRIARREIAVVKTVLNQKTSAKAASAKKA